MAQRKSKSENNKEGKPDSSVRVAIISTIGIIATTLITALFAPAILKVLDKTPTPPSTEVPIMPISEKEIFTDDFATNSKYWNSDCPDYDLWIASCSIANGTFRWQVSGITDSLAVLESSLPTVSDFDIEIALNLVDYSPGGWYGLRFRNSKTGTYQFLLNHKGDFAFFNVQYTENGIKYNEIIPGKQEPAININQENEIRVTAVGNKIRLYINDKLIGDVSDNSYSTGIIEPIIWLDKDRTLILDITSFKLILLPP